HRPPLSRQRGGAGSGRAAARPGRGRVPPHGPPRRHRPFRGPLPGGGGSVPAPPPPSSRLTHPAVAAASQGGRPPPGGPTVPIVLETYREILQDDFDLPALTEVLADIRSRRIRIVEVEVPSASPFASSLLFAFIAAYMYEADTPLAERRAAALTLDRDLLAE